jgi:putative ABC transport system permease protein
MLKTFLKSALRNLFKDKLYSLINILGLAIGVTCFVFIALWVLDELSYDRFLPNVDRLYRVAVDNKVNNTIQQYAASSSPMAVTMAKEFPEVEKFARFNISRPTLTNPETNEIFRGDNFTFVDPEAIEMLDLKFIAGDPSAALSSLNSVILTEEMATKYFGDADPIGKSLHFSGRPHTVPDERDYQVTGVFENFPQNSHFNIDFLASYATLEHFASRVTQNWDWYFSYSYVLLKEDASPRALEAKLPEMVSRNMPAESAAITRIWLEPVADIHLHSNLMFGQGQGDITNVYLFSAVAVLILLIACVNFMNLATARSLKRSKEVGVKKVMGAGRKQLIYQFLGESIITSLLAVIIAVGLMELLLPQFNLLAQKNLSVHYWGNHSILPGLLGLIIVLGLMSGSYPAFFLSAFNPMKVLKGGSSRTTGGAGHSGLRKGLIVFQFVIAIVLVIGTQVVRDQLEYFRDKKLGFDKDQVVWLRLPMQEHYESFKNTLLANAAIQRVARASGTPVGQTIRYGYRSEAMSPEDQNLIPTFSVDHEYASLLSLEMVAGRSFSREFGTDSAAYVINESAVGLFGWEKPEQAIGQRLRREDAVEGEIIGVVKNFNFTSLRQEIEPLVMSADPSAYNLAFAKLAGGNIPATLEFIEQTYRTFFPGQPYLLSFLEQTLENQYRTEIQLGKVFTYFASLAIFIACLGLFGLSSFSAEQHTKEIGVRKVLGASVSSIIVLLSKEFSRLVLVAFVVGCPLAYYFMNRWLSDFAYRIEISPPTFLLAGALALGIALISVSYNAIRAALANPVESLRYE